MTKSPGGSNQLRGRGAEKRAACFPYFIIRVILSHGKGKVSSTSACIFPCWPPDRCPLGPFQKLKPDFIIPRKSGATPEVAEIEFSWQTSTQHQHRTYKYILISVHCKISPTTRSGLESRWCPLSTPGTDPWNVGALPHPLLHPLLGSEHELHLGRSFSTVQSSKPAASPLGRLNRTHSAFCTLRFLSGVNSLSLTIRASVFTTVPRTFLCSSPWRTFMVRGFGTFLKYNVLLSPCGRLWSRFRPQSWKLGGVFEVAVTQRASILDIQPFLKTSCMEKMAARRDHGRFHVLKERLKEAPQKSQPFNL